MSIRGLHISGNGLNVMQRLTESISNNLANIKTPGYKKIDTSSHSIGHARFLTPDIDREERDNMYYIGLGSAIDPNTAEFSKGDIVHTGKQYDIAIMGNGFFQVTNRTGEIFYMQRGDFSLDSNRNLVASNGYLLDPNIVIPQEATDVEVTDNGIVKANVNGTVTDIGTIALATFPNENGLTPMDGGVFQQTTASGAPIIGEPGSDSFGSLKQFFIENSNVNAITAMTNLMEAQQAFDFLMKAMKANADMDKEIAR